ncbi:MAG: sugar ABC transporter permease [Anaerolineae bacterium]
MSVWQWVGLPTMFFLAGLLTISDELTEAARVDGASSWQIFWHIKFPLLLPVIGIVAVLTFVGNVNAFDIVYAMAGARGEPAYSTDLLGTFFYRTAIAGEHPVAIPNMGIGSGRSYGDVPDPVGGCDRLAGDNPAQFGGVSHEEAEAFHSCHLCHSDRLESGGVVSPVHHGDQLGQAPA